MISIFKRLKDELIEARVAILVGLCLALLIRLHGLPVIGGGVIAELADARKALAEVKAARGTATAAQIAVNREPARTSALIAGASNAQTPDYLDRVRRAGTERVRAVAQCSARAADLPGADRALESADHAAEAADMVSVSRTDWADLVAAAGQAAVCARDGRALIDAGLAVEAAP